MVDLLPSSIREPVGFYVAPLLGLAGIVLITTVYGWLSPFRTSISLGLSIGLVLLGVGFEKQRTELLRDWLTVSAFAVVATIPILAPAFQFDSFNPFNDTFTYLVHGQWLQQHAFSEAARSSGFFPAETQVALYQGAGHRMGGSFFLGFVQSLFHLEWSYYAYLATVSLVFALGSLAIGGVIQQVVPVTKVVALTLCTLPAFSMNGFVFGAQFGFFPQTFGLAFAAGLACLIPGLVAYTLSAKPSWTKQFLYLLPLTLCCSALLLTYNDMFPVLGAGIGLFLLLVGSMHWEERNRIALSLLIFTVQVMTVINIEGVRIIRNLLHTIVGAASGDMRFGWPVLWSPIQFIAHSFGMKSPFDNHVLRMDGLISSWIFPALLLAILVILVKLVRARPINLVVLFLIAINFVFWLAFLKFRYATAGIGQEVGFTFLQFKLAKWLSPFNLGLLGISIAWFLVNLVKYKFILKFTFATAFVAGLYIHYTVVAQEFMKPFQGETLRTQAPFSVLLDLKSRLANIPTDQVIYLGIPQEHHKLTQMVAYILSDRKLSSHYEDNYMGIHIPESERNLPPENSNWYIQLKQAPTIDENPLNRVGPFYILHAPFSIVTLESIKGAYATEETIDKKSRNWVKDSVEYRFHLIGEAHKAKVKFKFLIPGSPRILFVELDTKSGKRISSFEIPMKGGWGDYESPIMDINSEDVILRFKASGNPARLSEVDSREVKFLIENLSLESGS